jgi:biotin carboxyl carrier protein
VEFRYQHHDQEYTIRLEPAGENHYTATIGDNTYTVQLQRHQSGELWLMVNDKRLHAYTANTKISPTAPPKNYVALLDPTACVYELTKIQLGSTRRKTSGTGGDSLNAQMPGQVTQVLVVEGDTVKQGQPLLILEAMKMEIRLTAPHDGVVAKLLVKSGDTVERGQQLVEIQTD